jgi:formylglycine-generating enzyme required for sulfatase activity
MLMIRIIMSRCAWMVALSSLMAVLLLEGPPQAQTKEKKKPEKSITNSLGMKLMLIPEGKFTMGSPTDEKERYDDELQHEVTIPKAFYMGAYEVTQEEYTKIIGNNNCHFSANGYGRNQVKGLDTNKFPMEMVSFHEAVSFCEKLSAKEEEKKAGRTYRLPTEAEWERACRGGAKTQVPFHFGKTISSKGANIATAITRPCKVGSYKPNAFGLYDMHGNVCEWCSDWYDKDYYESSPKKGPTGPKSGYSRIHRGGSWAYYARNCRSAARDNADPNGRYHDLGFRVVMEVSDK